MIFRQWKQVLDGTKTQTRRPVKASQESNRWDIETDVINEVIQWLDNGKQYPANMRSIYVVGHTYAVQPGRGKKSKGRIHVQKIRRERLGDISDRDCLAEGVGYMPQHSVTDSFIPFSVCPICHRLFPSPQLAFACLWDCCGGRWEQDQNNDVWVLEVESGSGL